MYEATEAGEHREQEIRHAVEAALHERDRQVNWSRRDVYQIIGIAVMFVMQLFVAGNYIKGIEASVMLNTQAIATNMSDRYTATRAASELRLRDERIDRSLALAAESKALVGAVGQRTEAVLEKLTQLSIQLSALQAILGERGQERK